MFAPLRSLVTLRPRSSIGVLAGIGVGTVVFSATPFIIPELSARLGVGLGTAGLISTAQVAGFAVAAFWAGRSLTPSARLVAGAAVGLGLSNLASAVAPSFAVLLLTRVLAGLAMGVTAWIAWAQASRVERGIAEVAAIGPVVAIFSSPLMARLVEIGGDRLAYLALGAVAVASSVAPVRLHPSDPVGRTVSPSRSNRVLLGALALFALAGSSLFVFAAGAGTRSGLGPTATAIAFSLNALAGLVATRLRAGRRHAGPWMAITGLAALAAGTAGTGAVFLAGMAMWGFAWWMGMPAVLHLIAERSLRPDERMGDAQSLMAIGRVAGPALGGLLLGADRFGTLSSMACVLMLVVAVMVAAVEHHRWRTG